MLPMKYKSWLLIENELTNIYHKSFSILLAYLLHIKILLTSYLALNAIIFLENYKNVRNYTKSK